MKKLRNLLRFVFLNFGPIVLFYAGLILSGLKAAVIVSVAWTLGEILYHKIKKKSFSKFFIFSSAVVIGFGVVDLYLQKSVLFRYEAVATNVLVGAFFGFSLFGKKPLIQEFAEAQGRMPKELTPDRAFYFRFLTSVWTFYFFLKAGFYLWVADAYGFGEGLAIRTAVGNITFYALLYASIFGSKQGRYVLGKLRLLPSSKLKDSGPA